MGKKKILLLTLIILPLTYIFAEEHSSGMDMTHRMTDLVIKLGIIIIVGRIGGMLIKQIKLPSVLGELLAGIILGPILLAGTTISPELYSFSTIASILLLFYAGLETDLELFLKFAFTGTIVGLGGAVLSFVTGDLLGMLLLKTGFLDPRALFLGILSTATSVGITARILSDHKKMDSPEGVTILSAAVIDDVIGIILLAVVLGIASLQSGNGEQVSFGAIGIIALKAVGFWLGFTAAGLIFAKPLSKLLKRFKDTSVISVFTFAIALILAGVFEKFGLAMIIGAYILGLSLSKTDLNYVIQEKLHSLYHFLVPIFFTVMGLMVEVESLLSWRVLLFGLVFGVIAILAKVIGAGIPALFMNFNRHGALRIGVGMVPRGEVALIIAGLGISTGIIDHPTFSMAIIMTLITTMVSPPILNLVLNSKKKGVRKEEIRDTSVETIFECSLDEMAEMVSGKIINNLEKEDFYTNMVEGDDPIYKLRKNDVFMSMFVKESRIHFETSKEDVGFIKTLFFESILDIQNAVVKIQKVSKPHSMKRELMNKDSRKNLDYLASLSSAVINLHLKGESKEDIIREMVDMLDNRNLLLDKEKVLQSVLDREDQMSTGMQDHIALPHGKSSGVDSFCTAIGIKQEGVDFDAIDNLPSKIFIMIISPEGTTGPHIQFLSSIGSILIRKEARDGVLKAETEEDIIRVLSNQEGVAE